MHRRELIDRGLSRQNIHSRLRSGRLKLVLPSVYRVAGSPPSWQASVLAALLWAGDAATLSHRTAATLWQIRGQGDGPIELIVRSSKRVPKGASISLHTAILDGREIVRMPPFVLTSATRTLFDLGAVVPFEEVEEAVDEALRRKLTSTDRLRAVLEANASRGRPGSGALKRALLGRDGVVPESVMERRLLRLLRAAGLPDPVAQFDVIVGDRFVARLDFAYPEHAIAIEADSYRWHSGRAAWERDRRRASELAALGWRVLFVTWEEMNQEPDRVVARVRRLLARVVVFSAMELGNQARLPK